MWLRLFRTSARVHDAPTPKFACSSFKDVDTLFSGDAAGDADADADAPGSPTKPPILHRNRSIEALVRSLSQNGTSPTGVTAPETRIPGADDRVVVYFTSLRVVRRVFEDCKAVRTIMRSFRVLVDERDVYMDSRFMDELQRVLGFSERSKVTLPQIFIGGRYIGGAEEVRNLHENGEMKSHVEGLPVQVPDTCEECGGYRFILCRECSGSHRCFDEKSAGFMSCTLCSENGLIRCSSSCLTAPL